jgi:SAM-dependent methyltransferase
MESVFDHLAEAYNSSLEPVPRIYVKLIRDTFGIEGPDRVLDLGCGTGWLTFPLAGLSRFVEGLDCSRRMLAIARKRDEKESIRWTCQSAEEFQVPCNSYKLIISFESFHLFSDQAKILAKCLRGLSANGHFAIGWCDFFWEPDFRGIIVDVFQRFGIHWGEWGYQSYPDFPTIATATRVPLSPLHVRSVEVNSISRVSRVALYLANVGKSASLGAGYREALARDLEAQILRRTGTDRIEGISTFNLKFCGRAD